MAHPNFARAPLLLLSVTSLALAAGLACRAPAPKHEAPWTVLFDGETLKGWTTHGGRYDGDALWTVEDGALTGRQSPKGGGGLIYTDKLYADCDFACDFKIDEPMDSGVFLRMVPDEKGMQVTIDDHDDGELGGLYADGWIKHNPEGWKLFKRGEWNHIEISCSGLMAIDACINGQELVSHALPPNTVGYAPVGRIGLQVHGGQGMPAATRVQFRDIKVRERQVPGGGDTFVEEMPGWRSLTQAQMLAGWRSLFDGQTLEGWEISGPKEGVDAVQGVLRLQAGDGDVHTAADFKDFELWVDFRTSELANSGVFLRAARDGSNPAYSGCEIQILDDFNWEKASGSKLKEWQFSGSLYGSVPPSSRAALKPVAEWNRYHIVYRGSQLAVELNGTLLYDVDTLKVAGDPPFAKRAAAGFIGLQRHGGAQGEAPSWVEFRNLFIRKL